MSGIGKRIGQRLYLHVDQVVDADSAVTALVAKASCVLKKTTEARFNVLRLNEIGEEVAFLDYPGLGTEPFPALVSSWRVHLPSELVTYRSYAESLNPPILHRTELFLSADHSAIAALRALSTECESVGLFDNPRFIGFRQQWDALIREKGYRISATELVALGNEVPDMELGSSEPTSDTKVAVDRHLTALTRSALSAPVQSLIRDGLLTKETSFFDYGCGKGDDLAALELAGFQGTGWDPHFRQHVERVTADVVNLGFVINVIESRDERIQALESAYRLCSRVLAVATMIMNSAPSHTRSFGDGILTSRNTFQKYYTQAELQQFLESTLEEDAYPAAPGVFYVFRDRAAEQRYLLERTRNRSRVARARLACIVPKQPSIKSGITRITPEHSPEAQAALAQLWETCLELGRLPEASEIANSDEVRRYFRTLNRALKICVAQNSREALVSAALSRQSDILVMIALHFFGRRRNLNLIDVRLKRDIRIFFGSMLIAEAKSRELLFSIQSTAEIRSACELAASKGLGWYETGESLQLHTSLLERLPAVLRAYVGCATVLAGSLDGWDLIKVHINSGKVTLMAFDDFQGKPLPLLTTRVKIRLRDQDLDIFEYGGSHPLPNLYRKSRFINEEFPRYADQIQFEETLDSLKLFDLSGYGPSSESFRGTLSINRWEIDGFTLRRSTRIPALDEPCGSSFRYGDLVHCGETWFRTRIGNTPEAPDTYNALNDLAKMILDPVVEYFGAIKLTYGFASAALTRHIAARISPSRDQHASCEVLGNGNPICVRLGAAVDFVVEDEDMYEVGRWISENCPFDRIYLYGKDKPLHVSVGPSTAGEVYELIERAGRLIPRRCKFKSNKT